MSEPEKKHEESVRGDDGNDRALTLSNFLFPSLYQIKLTVNHTKPNFSGEVEIDLETNNLYNGEKPTHFELGLHRTKLVILGAQLRTQSGTHVLKTEAKGNEVVVFKSEEEVDYSQIVSLSIKYMGKINAIKTYKDQTQGSFKTNYADAISGQANNFILATHTQPHAARQIFPLVDELYKKVPIQLTIMTLSRFKVISNTPLAQEPKPVSMSENSIFEFKKTPPISPGIFGFVIGDIEYIESKNARIPTRVYTTIGSSARARYGLSLLEKFLPTIEQTLDFEYPLEKLDVVGIPFFSDGVMENWGMITLQEQLLLAEPEYDEPEKIKQLQQMIAHELVHQWMGNLVSFDSWKSLWLNEAFATWLGNYITHISGINVSYKYDIETENEVESIMERDCFLYESGPSLKSIFHSTSSIIDTVDATTENLFETNTYEKGIALLRMVSYILNSEQNSKSHSSPSETRIFEGLNSFLEKYQYKSVKELDLWTHLNDFTSCDLPKLVYSWTRMPGFPIAHVSFADGKLKFEQHRYLSNTSYTESNMEDQPYHVPLLLRVIDKNGEFKILNIVLTDRNTEIEMPLENLIQVNHEKGGYYKVVYSPEILDNICSKIRENKLTRLDSLSLINDYGKILGTFSSTSMHLNSFISLAEVFTHKDWEIDFEVLRVMLSYLETITLNLIHFSPYERFGKWLDDYIVRMYNKVGGWESISSLTPRYDSSEMQARNSILQLGIRNPKFQALGKSLFKNFLSSGLKKAYTPKELLSSILNLTIAGATLKEYKKILELVKNSNNSQLKNTNASQRELQTVAVSSLSFTDNLDLCNKTLNFVMTNIDSKLIELALIGFQYKADKQFKLMLFKWYKLHYDQWTLKSLRKGSDWAAQLHNTLQNITKIVIGEILQYDTELLKLKSEFIKEKLQKLPEHGLSALLERIETANQEKELIGSFYADFESKNTL